MAEEREIKTQAIMKKAELIFVPVPGAGHLVSTLEFAKLLLEQDERILITALVIKHSPFSSLVDSYTQSLVASEPRIQLIDFPPVDLPPSDLFAKSIERYVCDFIESHIPHLRNIVSNIMSSRSNSDSVRVAGLVLDLFCVSMVDVANEFGLPSYIFLTSNAGFLGMMLRLASRHEQISTEFTNSDADLIIPGFVNPVPPRVLPSALFNTSGGYTAYIEIAQRFKDAKGIIVNTFTELETYALESFSNGEIPPIYPVGPVLNPKSMATPDLDQAQWSNIMKWLGEQPQSSVVFLCFGSSGSFSAPQVKEIALGVERSGYKFLWSMRLPPPPNDDSASGDHFKNPEEMLPEGFLERIEGRGMICGWAPQVEVLAHKATGGFISHCGWNSIVESLWYGVPIVTWPIYAEQQLNAYTLVKELGLSVELKLDYRKGGDLVMAEEIGKAVRCVMETDSEVRKKVKEMRGMARSAVVEGGSSFVSITKLIKDILGSS